MHTLRLLRRRFPVGYPMLVMLLSLLVLALLIVGAGMLFAR